MGLIGLLQGVHSLNQDDLSYDYEISRTLAQQAGLQLADP
jgi:hypothetical protein